MQYKDFDFRIWDKQKGKFYYKDDENVTFNSHSTLEVEQWKFSFFISTKDINYNDIEIELWSGFYDKNNKKIYENDIVSYKNFNDDITKKTERVVFEKGSFIFKSSYSSITNIYTSKDIEVIGNTHENQELLKAKTCNRYF